jgi:hypothetical protein
MPVTKTVQLYDRTEMKQYNRTREDKTGVFFIHARLDVCFGVVSLTSAAGSRCGLVPALHISSVKLYCQYKFNGESNGFVLFPSKATSC